MTSTEPRRGEVWLVAFGATRPGEPGKHRPAVVVSADEILAGPSNEPVVVVPLSSSASASDLRPTIAVAEGVERPSRAVCGAIRGLARSRFVRRLGVVREATLADLDRALAVTLALDGTS